MSAGRPRKFSSPEELLCLFENYKKWAKNNPWYKREAIKSGEHAGTIIKIEHERPLTEWEFSTFLGISRNGLINYGTKQEYKEFFNIYACIKDEMSAQRISGGLVDAFNANLVARINGIREKQEIEHSGELKTPPTELSVKIINPDQKNAID